MTSMCLTLARRLAASLLCQDQKTSIRADRRLCPTIDWPPTEAGSFCLWTTCRRSEGDTPAWGVLWWYVSDERALHMALGERRFDSRLLQLLH
jgi:hypothetical protein